LRQLASEHAFEGTEIQRKSDATATVVTTLFKEKPRYDEPYYASNPSALNYCWREQGFTLRTGNRHAEFGEFYRDMRWIRALIFIIGASMGALGMYLLKRLRN